METVKDILKFCNDAIFYDYHIIRFIEELNQVRKCIINNFHKTKNKTTPVSKIKVSLSLIDDITLKIVDNDIDDVTNDVHDLRENILYMLSLEKLVRDNGGKWIIEDKILPKPYWFS